MPLKVVIRMEGGDNNLTCDGETIIVNLHGALLVSAVPLAVGMRISVQVFLTGKRSSARVAYVDPRNPLQCGIELDQPQNIWGVQLPPSDWIEPSAEKERL